MIERRSGLDSRSEAEKRLVGERRTAAEQQAPHESSPSADQLALFARRMRRVLRDEKARPLLGVAIGEGHFTVYPDVLRVVDWIEQVAASNGQDAEAPRPSLRKVAPAKPDQT
jgi:hypothetical protein